MNKLTGRQWPLLALMLVFQAAAVESAEVEYRGKIAIDYSKEMPLLGISSIRYDESKKQFILLSDDTGIINNTFGGVGEARYYTIPESEIWRNGEPVQAFEEKWAFYTQQHILKPDNDIAWINNGHIDTEKCCLAGQG